MAYGAPVAYDPTNVMGRRIAAWFIDVFLVTLIAFGVGYALFFSAATKVSNVPVNYCTYSPRATGSACVQLGNTAYVGTEDDVGKAVAVGGLIYLIGALNLFVLQGTTGAAVGKHIFGLRVIRQDGRLVGFGANIVRTLMLIVDQFCAALVGLITASVTHPHRRVGDFVANTYVVSKESVGTPIGVPMGAPGYGGQWAAPPAAQWQPPPTGVPPQSAPPPTTWGTRPATEPASTAPPAWGTPAAVLLPTSDAPVADVPVADAPVADAPVSETPFGEPPVSEAPTAGAPTAEAPGWAAPTPAPAPQPQAAAAPQASPPGREAQWDAQRNAWVFWQAETSSWLQFDPTNGKWGPLR